MKTCKARMCRQLVKEPCLYTGTWLPLLRIPFFADLGYQEEHFLRSTYPCGPKSGSQTTSEINVVQNDITLEADIANLERSHSLPRVFSHFQKNPQTNVRPLHV